jgi:histidine kinase/histidine kinase/DNA gyrase B/HSP90-like ATPase
MMDDDGLPVRLASLVVVFGCLALGAVGALEAKHVSTVHNAPIDWATVLVSTTPRWIGLAFMMPVILRVATRVPLTPVRVSVVALHVALVLAVSLSHAALDMWAQGIVNPFGKLAFSFSARITRSWYNTLPTVVTTYAAVLFAAWGMSEARERQRRTLRASRLEAQLQSARLATLRAQVQPHFLYNTLNAIAALVAGAQPERAVVAIEELSELLHASLRDDGREEIRIDEEVTLVGRYLALQRMRFGDRLIYDWNVAPDAAECLVPVLLLQPIVENAVVHGLDAGNASLSIQINVASTHENLVITVENDGSEPRPDSTRGGHGVGLAATRARLMTAHGDRASLTLQPRAGGGAIVRIEIPRRRAASSMPAHNAALREVTA